MAASSSVAAFVAPPASAPSPTSLHSTSHTFPSRSSAPRRRARLTCPAASAGSSSSSNSGSGSPHPGTPYTGSPHSNARKDAARKDAALGLGGVLGTNASALYDDASHALYNFLTRRAVDTLLVYMDEFHDGPGKNWLENFDNFHERKHDFKGADSFLLAMLRTPPQTGTMTIRHPRGYFKREFKFSIEPRRIAERLLAIRAQLATEWMRDLQLIHKENMQLDRLRLERTLKPSENLDKFRERILDEDPFALDDSALRSANYAKLKVMMTHYASYAVLEDMHHSDNHSYMWLLSYLQSHKVKNDEDFVFALMHEPRVQMTNPEQEVNPLDIAERILARRLAISKDWIFLLGSTEEANRRLLVAVVMGSTRLEDLKVRAEKKLGGASDQELNSGDVPAP